MMKQIYKDMNERKLEITLISNIVFEPYLKLRLSEMFNSIGVQLILSCVLFDEYSANDSIEKLSKSNIFVVAINYEALCLDYPNGIYDEKIMTKDIICNVERISEKLYCFLKSRFNRTIIWFGFEDYCNPFSYVIGNVINDTCIIDCINARLESLISNGDIFVDLKRLIADIGISNAYDFKGKYRWNAPYSKVLVWRICDEIYKQYNIINGISKKCIILDCDNVLWGGILSEDGIEKILIDSSGLGKQYQDFQRFLLYLYYHGVILTVCSKNEYSDVMCVFKEHSGMILKEENIACFKVNWENKIKNVMDISEELNIGLDSMVFVDDSDNEINLVSGMLPEVTTILYDRNTIYKKLCCFNLKSDIDIDKVKQRNDTYKTNVDRKALRNMCDSETKYLALLEMKTDIHRTKLSELGRIAELSQRTNKCTNGVRHTIDELKSLISEVNYQLYSVFVSDKFSNLGLVGTIGIKGDCIDMFSLSCRALGREIEKEMLQYTKFCGVSTAIFIYTGKNTENCRLFESYDIKIC